MVRHFRRGPAGLSPVVTLPSPRPVFHFLTGAHPGSIKGSHHKGTSHERIGTRAGRHEPGSGLWGQLFRRAPAQQVRRMSGMVMTEQAILWPQKRRELHNHHFDSTVWNDFRFRDDDIVIGTYAKSGTTWTQQIVSQLIFAGVESLNVADMSPWVDLRV